MLRKLLVSVISLAAFAVVAAPGFAGKACAGGESRSQNADPCGDPAPSSVPKRPSLRKPSDNATIKKRPGGVTFFVRARAKERAGSLGIQLADADARVRGDGSFVNPDEDESGEIDQFLLRRVKAGDTLYSVRVPNSVFSRYSDDNFYWQAYRILPERRCRTMKNGKLDCFQQSRVRAFAYRIFG